MPEPTGSRRVLWVTDQPPHRSLGGGAIRQAHLFDALAREYSVDLLLAGTLSDERVRAMAHKVIEVPRPAAFWTENRLMRKPLLLGITLASPYPLAGYLAGPGRRQLVRALRECHQEYDVVCVEHEGLVPVIPTTRSQPWIITLHNRLSGMMDTEAQLAPNASKRWFRSRDAVKARRLEERAVRTYDRCITCAETDAAALAAVAGLEAADRIRVVPNGVDLEEFRVTPVPEAPVVLFPGTLCYPPNVDGAKWLCSEIWPQVRAAVPEARLVLAGRAPTQTVLTLADSPGVEVHADVPSMVPYFETARAVVVPLRVGTGTRLKALEAMAAGRPVIGTTVGLDGIGVADGVQGRVADDPTSFAAAVVEVLRRGDLAEALGTAGRHHVEAHFGWQPIGRQFVDLVDELLQVPARRLSSAGAGP